MSSSDYDDIFEEIEKIESLVLDNFMNYAVYNNDPKPNFEAYLQAITIIQTTSNKGDLYNEQLLSYHNDIISNYIKGSSDIVDKIDKYNFIDELLVYSEKINIVIYWIYKLFKYLDQNYTKIKKNGITLPMYSLNSYKNNFFIPLKERRN